MRGDGSAILGSLSRRARSGLFALGAGILSSSVAAAQPAPAAPSGSSPPAAPPPADSDAPSEAKKGEARTHFERGVALSKDSAFAAALAEFLLSRKLFPTRASTQNAALLLRKLERFDEALDMYEALLRDFSNLAPEDKIAAQKSIVELRALVGTIDVDGAEVGAAILVDGASRGDYPPPSPLRVAAGAHTVRLYKEGFEPFERRVDVPGGELTRIKAHLRTLTQIGRLKVTEQTGKTLDVFVDGVIVGKTPWEGPLSEGHHAVVLRGEGRIGTQPAAAPVKEKQLTPLILRAEELTSGVRVTPTPAGATIAIDAVVVGRGFWEGWLKAGSHRVEIASEGFVTVVKDLSLDPGHLEPVTIELQRDAGSPLWRKPSKIVVDVTGAFAIAPTFGGDVAGSCNGSCSRSLGVGGHVALEALYELGSGYGIGISAGYLSVEQHTTGRAATFTPTGLPTQGSVDDQLLLRGMTIGAFGSLVLGDRTTATLRLGAGALIGTLRDERSGRFTSSIGASAYDTSPVTVAPGLTSFYLAPEIRVGRRVGEHAEIGVGLKALLLLGANARWDSTVEIPAGKDGVGTYAADPLTGSFFAVLLPLVGGRYEF